MTGWRSNLGHASYIGNVRAGELGGLGVVCYQVKIMLARI